MKAAVIGWVALALVGCDNTNAISASDESKADSQKTVPRICIVRATVYAMTVIARNKGIPQYEWVRDLPKENAQMRDDLKKTGITSYLDAVDAIYHSTNPEETVRQLSDECAKSGRN